MDCLDYCYAFRSMGFWGEGPSCNSIIILFIQLHILYALYLESHLSPFSISLVSISLSHT